MPESDAVRLARLEERFTSVLRELDRLTRDVETFGPVAGQVIEVIAEVRSLTEDLMELRRVERDARGMSTTVKVALIGGSFALLTALIAALAQIMGGG